MSDNTATNPSYRAIVPAASASLQDEAAGPAIQQGGLLPKARSVALACNNCRKARTKCNGQRPSCDSCIARGKSCRYEETRARHLATRSRLKSMERLIDALKASPAEEADRILQRLRTGKGLADSFEDLAGLSAGGDGKPSSTPSVSPDEIDENIYFAPQAHEPDQSSIAIVQAIQTARGGSYESVLPLVPGEAITKEAIDAFYSCSGKLFHVFPREVIDQAHQIILNGSEHAGMKGGVALCFTMAVAACGALYVNEPFHEGVERTFYDLARHCSEAVAVYQPLDAIKICSLLALYNILDKDTVSLSYVESGLGMCRRNGLSCGGSRPSTFTESEWTDYRRTWRTLMFFSSWLSATLGYISGNDILSERVSLSEVSFSDSPDLAEILQTQMARICLIKADMFSTRLSFDQLTASSIHAILNKLQGWHKDLPETLHLSCIGRDELAVEVKRAILQLHLLYLGATMLLYRRVSSELARSHTAGVLGTVVCPSLEGTVAKVAGEAVLAARTSARILMLLSEYKGMFKRCWIVVFQSYTSCVMMLHSMAQRQLHSIEPALLEGELRGVSNVLGILRYCGSSDQVAADFYEQLSPVFDKIKAKRPDTVPAGIEAAEAATAFGGGPSLQSTPEEPGPRDFHYLTTLPDAEDPRADACLALLRMISRPFTGPMDTLPAADEKLDDPATGGSRGTSQDDGGSSIPSSQYDTEHSMGGIPSIWGVSYHETRQPA